MNCLRVLKFVFIVLLAIIKISVNAQFAENTIPVDKFISKDSGKFYLNFSNANFLKNNEYFNSIVEGYTLPGYWITPVLEYHPSSNSAVTGGVHLLHFSGHNNFFNILPVFSFSQQLNKNICLIIGTLQSDYNHRMPEPMLSPERFYFKQVENGLQFIAEGSKVKSDIWLSWDHFIWYGDSVQEKLTTGISNEFILIKKSAMSLSIPLQALITHKGGQINRPKQPIETLINLSSGLYLDFIPENSFFKQIRINPQFFIYNKPTSDTLQPFNNGWAVYPNIFINANPVLFKLSWWYSGKFIGPRGEEIYQCISKAEPGYFVKHRNLFIGKIAYFKELGKNFSISVGFEGYYDRLEKLFDYNYSLHLTYNGKLLLWK